MPAKSSKKPVAKLKVGKKAKINKWLIVAGVAVVAVVGVVVVRYSGASSASNSNLDYTNCVTSKRNTARYCNAGKWYNVVSTGAVNGSYRYCAHLVYHRGTTVRLDNATYASSPSFNTVALRTGNNNRDDWAETRVCSNSVSGNARRAGGVRIMDGSAYVYSMYLQ